MFLNCNYPNKLGIPKGKPREIKRVKLQIKKDGITLIIDQDNNVYFADNGYYWGINLNKFLVKNMFGVNIFETICNINNTLLDWNDGRDDKFFYSQLGNEREDLLRIYLKTL